MRKINVVLIVVGALALIFVWLINISVQTELIPTIVNGEVIATSTAIIFTGIFFTIGWSNRLLELQKRKIRRTLFSLFSGLPQFLW